jgi:hypothetical protein
MKSFSVDIAGYKIKFESAADGPELLVSEKLTWFISSFSIPDLLIRVHRGSYDLPVRAQRVFHAPYIEEINGVYIKHKDQFWSVWKSESYLFIKTIFPLLSDGKKGVLRFTAEDNQWDLWIDGEKGATDPFEYPIDALILYYLTVMSGDIFIHASGVEHSGRGYLFSGVSGMGKSTMARIWKNAGSSVIHDDRLIIRNTGSTFRMYNTPLYNYDRPAESEINDVFLIEHGEVNNLVEVNGARSVSMVLSNCIQHDWDPGIVSKLLASVAGLCEMVPVKRLYFRPDVSVIDHILKNEG